MAKLHLLAGYRTFLYSSDTIYMKLKKINHIYEILAGHTLLLKHIPGYMYTFGMHRK